MDFEHENPPAFKKFFNDKDAENEYVGVFLFPRGGIKGGTWNWDQVGTVNGALLWQDSFRYLIGKLSEHL